MDPKQWRTALAKTRRSTFGRIATLLGATELTPDFWEELGAALIQTDMGENLTKRLVIELQEKASLEGLLRGEEITTLLRSLLIERLTAPVEPALNQKPHVLILIGVNGTGKTTTAAKLAFAHTKAGLRVLLAAADTYRAAAQEQLSIWGERLGVEVISAEPGSDPGALVHNACQAAQARNTDVAIVDTSGRMHTEHNLMAELQKIYRVVGKFIDGGSHEVLLVLDATTGQNGLAQAQAFAEAIHLDGVILTKLDGSAKGGVGFAIVDSLGIPMRYVGIGERLEDLAVFDPQAFVDALLLESGSPTV
ncbi:MAG: signal recognition particle-docking protein FtsY [Anaerolineales bacterium]|nr:signal recognition particle-docking protein FtsY [Anaerolineales bacterium]